MDKKQHKSSSRKMRVQSTTSSVSDQKPISAARRALKFGLVAKSEPTEPQPSFLPCSDPAISGNETPPLIVMEATVEQTVNGLQELVDGVMEVPLCYSSDVLERVEAMDMSNEEAEELIEQVPWHLKRWVSSIENVQFEFKDYVSSVPLTPSTSDVQPGDKVSPSTSEKKKNKRVSKRELNNGSDLDSEFDDEFDSTIDVAGTASTGKEIPEDEELEEPIRDLIVNVEKGMDDEADRLLGKSANFTWVEGFESFKGAREEFSGPTPGPIKDYDSPYDTFIDIFDKDIITHITAETNRYAKQKIENLRDKGLLKPSSRFHRWTDTNADEIMLLLGVFMYMAIDTRTTQFEYWNTDSILELPYFRQLMTYQRFVLLNSCLHFADNSGASHQSQNGVINSYDPKLMNLQPIIDHLGNKFSSLYNLNRDVSIDESLTLYKGRLSWVQTIRTKAARFGIKSYELCESHTGYMTRFQIYTGKSRKSEIDPSLGVELGGKTTKIVLDLLKGLEHRGHCVTMDNFYNCPSLARYLKSLGFDCLGTLRSNRRNVPSDIAKIPKNVERGTMISRQCGDVAITSWKDSRLVNIISTFHNDDTFIGSRYGKTLVKPVCVRDYNRTMGGVDLKDQKLSMYLLERKRGMKWYIKMFKRLLNVSIHNAFIMYVTSLRRQGKLAVTHREFRYELAKALVTRHRPCVPKIKQPQTELGRLRRDIVHVPKMGSGRNNRKRCLVCYRLKISKLVNSECTTCDVFLCFEECWKIWHSSAVLPGKEIRVRKRCRVWRTKF